MATAYIKVLKDVDNNTIYPQSTTSAVLNAAGETLDTIHSKFVSAKDPVAVEDIDTIYESTSNRVEIVNADSTNTTYPTAKAVHDFVTAALENIEGMSLEIASLGLDAVVNPSSSTIYLLPRIEAENYNSYDEYIYVNGWEKIGSTDIDLTGYVTEDVLANILTDYITKEELANKNYLDKSEASLNWLSTEGGVESKDEILAAADTKYAPINTVEVFTDVSVPVSLWVEDATYQEFAYKANIPCEGITTDYFPNVVFNVAEAISGNYAQICVSGDGIVTIYAVELPEADITIPSIVCTKEA